MMQLVRHITKRKELLVVVLLVTTFVSFALPKETFDPHLGVEFDIFCQLTSYMNIDPGGIGWISVVLFVPEAPVFNDFYTATPSVSPGLNLPIRAPPASEVFLLAA